MLKHVVMSVAALALASSAVAADATFYVEQGMASWSKTTIKPDGADKIETTTMKNMPNSLEVGVTMGKVNVYLFPTSEGTPLSAGYMLSELVELGGSFGMQSTKAGDSDAVTGNKYGLFVGLYPALPVGTVEASLSIGMVKDARYSNDALKDGTGTTIEFKGRTGTEMLLDLCYVYPIGKNINYTGAVLYSMNKYQVEPDKGDKVKYTENTLTLNVLALRATF